MFATCSDVGRSFLRTSEDDETETQSGLRAVRLGNNAQVFVSKKAVELLLEAFEKHLRSSVQALGQRSAFRSLEQVVKSISSSLARVEPRQVRRILNVEQRQGAC